MSIVDSQLKATKPLTVYSSALVDTANQKLYFNIFNKCLSSSADELHVERVAHLIMIAGKLKSATVTEALLPLLEKSLPSDAEGKDVIVQDMMDQNARLEEIGVKIEHTKKSPKNHEFLKLMKEMEAECDAAADLEVKALNALVQHVDESELIEGALAFEKAKSNANLAS